MKTRLGFVSNSSSSSFIVIGIGEQKIPYINEAYHRFGDKPHRTIDIPETFGGNYEFGWDVCDYTNFADRLNWAALCAYYKEGHGYDGYGIDQKEMKPAGNWTDMLVEVLKEDFKVDHVYINFSDNDDGEEPEDDPYGRKRRVWGYIDHQSAPLENEDASAMFKDKATLRQWLYAPDSVVHGNNDNH